MRKIPELDAFIEHFDWYIMKNGYYVPTEKASQEAIDAMEKVNKLLKYDRDNHCHRI